MNEASPPDRSAAQAAARAVQPETPAAPPVIFIASDRLGRGDDDLGAALMLSALRSLAKLPQPPVCLLFMNAGVKLCCSGSAALDDLRALADLGVEVLCCGTCLDYFGLVDRLAIGRASNMVEILTRQSQAGRLIRL